MFQVFGLRGGAYLDNEKSQSCVNTLIDLCNEVIKHLNNLKEQGLISEADYQKHIKTKKVFLETMSK
jgi:hypothetical protein